MEFKPLVLPPRGEFECFDRERLTLPKGKPFARGRTENEPGMAPEVLGLAPWEVSSRRISANASARMGTLIALESPRETGALPQLLLDQRRGLDFGSTTQTLNERIATIGLCLSRILVAGGPGCQVRTVDEAGFSRPFHLRSIPDWNALYGALKDRHLRKFRSSLQERLKAGPGQWVAIFSDNRDPHTLIHEWIGSPVPPLGLLRVYDPWEENPPRRGNIRLMDARGYIHGENWSDGGFRAALKLEWENREKAWQNLPESLLPKLIHRTDAPWRDALNPWLKGHRNP